MNNTTKRTALAIMLIGGLCVPLIIAIQSWNGSRSSATSCSASLRFVCWDGPFRTNICGKVIQPDLYAGGATYEMEERMRQYAPEKFGPQVVARLRDGHGQQIGDKDALYIGSVSIRLVERPIAVFELTAEADSVRKACLIRDQYFEAVCYDLEVQEDKRCAKVDETLRKSIVRLERELESLKKKLAFNEVDLKRQQVERDCKQAEESLRELTREADSSGGLPSRRVTLTRLR